MVMFTPRGQDLTWEPSFTPGVELMLLKRASDQELFPTLGVDFMDSFWSKFSAEKLKRCLLNSNISQSYDFVTFRPKLSAKSDQ
jgi:hypothetical protein